MTYDFTNLRTYAAAILALLFLIFFIYGLGHRGKGIIFSLLLFAGAGTLVYFEYTFQHTQTQASVAIQKTYDNSKLYLHCERLVDSLGDTVGADSRAEENNPGMVWVDNADCTSALSWIRGSKTDTNLDQAKALYAVSSEATQIAGGGGACAAIQNMSPLLVNLGATNDQAKAIASLYFTNAGDASVAGCAVF